MCIYSFVCSCAFSFYLPFLLSFFQLRFNLVFLLPLESFFVALLQNWHHYALLFSSINTGFTCLKGGECDDFSGLPFPLDNFPLANDGGINRPVRNMGVKPMVASQHNDLPCVSGQQWKTFERCNETVRGPTEVTVISLVVIYVIWTWNLPELLLQLTALLVYGPHGIGYALSQQDAPRVLWQTVLHCAHSRNLCCHLASPLPHLVLP